MYARIWHVRIRPGKLEEFKRAVDSVVPLAQQQDGFLGILPLFADERRMSEATLIALWESLEALRASERAGLVSQGISRLVDCCEGYPRIEEREIMESEPFLTKKPSTWSGRVI
jgi:quinol monooxygenase YgiN